MKLVYQVNDKPPVGKVIVLAFQQLLAIMAATIAVPMIVGNGMEPAAALFGAGVGSLIYVLFTKGKSPVFLGSSFAFLGSMFATFGGAASMQAGYAGLIIGAILAGLVYVIIALIVKLCGAGWVSKIMPAVVIGPTVAIIGLSLAGNAVGDLQTGDVVGEAGALANTKLCILCGLTALFVTMLCSVYGKKFVKLIPFIIGIVAGYVLAAVFTVIGNSCDIDAFKIIDFSIFDDLKIFQIPKFSFTHAMNGVKDIDLGFIGTVAMAYVPVAFVVFAEHIADHKNISSIIETDLLEEPGLHRTLLGDGVGSMAGAFFGGCPNTTYGESVACVAISGNASVLTIICTAVMAMLISFFGPFVAFLDSIPACVMGGICMSLYGFIAVSGLKMIQNVDLEDNRNLFVVSVILIAGIGGLAISFNDGKIEITEIACALILGILTNLILGGFRKKQTPSEDAKEEQ